MSSSTNSDRVESLRFSLEVEDEWPPVAVESLPFRVSAAGFELLTAPLFVKGLSAGDVISATLRDDAQVQAWAHVTRSKRTTIWLLRMEANQHLEPTLEQLRKLGCNTVTFDARGVYAVDVPESVQLEAVEEILEPLDPEAVAVAYPSLRHSE